VFSCSKRGLRDKKHFMRLDRKKEHRSHSHTNCYAKPWVPLDYKTREWNVASFIKTYNHKLSARKLVSLIPVCLMQIKLK